jgi:predicted MFS family arabinose efflux permease
VVFASTLFTRAVDPVVPKIAADLGIAVSTAALLSTAFTFPYALMQPVLGLAGDFFGKTRLMNLSLAIVVVTTLVCAFASNFSVLVAMRILAGMLAGGIFPVGIAIVGDLVPVEQRQVAIGRLLGIGLTGNLIGATISGVIGDLLGWRGVFLTIGGFGLVAVIAAFFAFRGLSVGKPKRFNLTAVAAGYRGIFADPRAKICFSSVFFEGITIHGMFPYVALLLLASGETRSSYAGIVIAGFGLGGILFSLSLPFLVKHVTERYMMLTGATLACIAFILIAAVVHARGGVPAVRRRLLHAAQLHSGSRHRFEPDRARHCDVDAFLLFLLRPGDRPDLLRVCIPAFRQQRAGASWRCRDRRGRPGLRPLPAAPAARWPRGGTVKNPILEPSARGAAIVVVFIRRFWFSRTFPRTSDGD